MRPAFRSIPSSVRLCIFICVFIPTSLLPSAMSQSTASADIVLKVRENEEAGTFVGDIYHLGKSKVNLTLENPEFYIISQSTQKQYRWDSDSSESTSTSQQKAWLKIDRVSGKLFVAHAMDREKLCPQLTHSHQICFFTVLISINKRYFLTARVEVENVNDEKPLFPTPQKMVTFSENDPVGTTQTLDLATDRDAQEDKQEEYHWVETEGRELFALDASASSLLMRLLRPLDYERQKMYNLTLEACDGDVQMPLCGRQSVIVNVIDTNDAKPQFPHERYTVLIPEDLAVGSLITNVTAYDPEEGNNGLLSYSLSHSKFAALFSINPTSGEVFLRAPVEGGESYLLHVEVKDNGEIPLYATTTLNVFVKDKNNHAPEMKVNPTSNSSLWNVSQEDAQNTVYSMYENNALGLVMAFISVKDRDKDENGRVRCFLKSQETSKDSALIDVESMFMLKEVMESNSNIYKLTLVQSLDREQMAQVVAPIVCHDQGKEVSHTSTQFIRIVLADQNEFPARFLQETYHVRLEEERQTVGDTLLLLEWKDEDAEHNVTFHVVGSAGMEGNFLVDAKGHLISRRSFDREQNDLFEFQVRLVDHGYPTSFTATTRVRVQIVDVNDHPPEFTQKGPFFILENEEVATVNHREKLLGQVMAQDKDIEKNAQISFELLNVTTGPPQHQKSIKVAAAPFRVDSQGSIYVTRVLDREMEESYDLDIVARDGGTAPQLSSRAMIRVVVLDTNDNAPQWVYPTHPAMWLNLSIPPHSIATSPAFVVTHLRAVDRDSGANSNLTYHILSHEDAFYVEAWSGVVQLLRQPEQDLVYRLRVSAMDRGQPPQRNETELLVLFTADPLLVAGVSARRRLSFKLLYILGLIAGSLIGCLCLMMCVLVLRRKQRIPPSRKSNNCPTAPLRSTMSMAISSVQRPSQVQHQHRCSSHLLPGSTSKYSNMGDSQDGSSGLLCATLEPSQQQQQQQHPMATYHVYSGHPGDNGTVFFKSFSTTGSSHGDPYSSTFSSQGESQTQQQVYWTPVSTSTVPGNGTSVQYGQTSMLDGTAAAYMQVSPVVVQQHQQQDWTQTDGKPVVLTSHSSSNGALQGIPHEIDEGSADSGHGASEEDNMHPGRGKCPVHFGIERQENGTLYVSRKSPYFCSMVPEEYPLPGRLLDSSPYLQSSQTQRSEPTQMYMDTSGRPSFTSNSQTCHCLLHPSMSPFPPAPSSAGPPSGSGSIVGVLEDGITVVSPLGSTFMSHSYHQPTDATPNSTFYHSSNKRPLTGNVMLMPSVTDCNYNCQQQPAPSEMTPPTATNHQQSHLISATASRRSAGSTRRTRQS